MGDLKVWKEGSSGEPKFSDKFEVIKKAVLQVTDIETNRNKYYAIELHTDKKNYRVYTHYGRTDDLESNPNAGIRESRYCSSYAEAEAAYNKIYKQKTSSTKGYKEINLASSKIGSKQSIGKSSGLVDDKTLKKLNSKDKKTVKATPISISPKVQELVVNLYNEATKALTKLANVSITAKGIETPLGVLTLGQIDSGQIVLDELAIALSKKKTSVSEIEKLSGQFYTLIPHRFGRSKAEALAAVINDKNKVAEKNDTLQLMRDMLNVNSKNNALVDPNIDKKYQALECEINYIDSTNPKFKELKDYIKKSRVDKWTDINIKNIYSIKREMEHKNFATNIGNNKLLFHGSDAKNWVGILSRGLLLPKVVTKLGVHRTDGGWLGDGIYFGDAICTSLNYAGSGKRDTCYVALANVALGKMKDYKEITYGLTEPPKGYDSCHGNPKGYSEFDDHEYVIYNEKQQKLEYLVEFDESY